MFQGGFPGQRRGTLGAGVVADRVDGEMILGNSQGIAFAGGHNAEAAGEIHRRGSPER